MILFPIPYWKQLGDSLLDLQLLQECALTTNLWKNTLLKFSLAGLAIGGDGVVLYMPNIGKKWPVVLGLLICGLASGALAGTIGLIVRQYVVVATNRSNLMTLADLHLKLGQVEEVRNLVTYALDVSRNSAPHLESEMREWSRAN